MGPTYKMANDYNDMSTMLNFFVINIPKRNVK